MRVFSKNGYFGKNLRMHTKIGAVFIMTVNRGDNISKKPIFYSPTSTVSQLVVHGSKTI